MLSNIAGKTGGKKQKCEEVIGERGGEKRRRKNIPLGGNLELATMVKEISEMTGEPRVNLAGKLQDLGHVVLQCRKHSLVH